MRYRTSRFRVSASLAEILCRREKRYARCQFGSSASERILLTPAAPDPRQENSTTKAALPTCWSWSRNCLIKFGRVATRPIYSLFEDRFGRAATRPIYSLFEDMSNNKNTIMSWLGSYPTDCPTDGQFYDEDAYSTGSVPNQGETTMSRIWITYWRPRVRGGEKCAAAAAPRLRPFPRR